MNKTTESYFDKNAPNILDEHIFGNKNSGFVDFNKTRYQWASNIYDLMNANTWFPSEIDTKEEKKNFKNLLKNEQNIYKMTFAQLSFNDSAQEQFLLDFRAKATNKIVQSTITLQAMQEVNHSKSYAVLLDACGNSEEVFNLYKTEEALATKNEAIAELFARYINGESIQDFLLSSMASINLEGIFFLTGFGFIYSLGDKVPGARDMIKFIARDELNTHLPLFANIFKTIKKENKIKASTLDTCQRMVEEAVNIELKYALSLIDKNPILGIQEDDLITTVNNYANERLKAIGLEEIYEKKEQSQMQKLVEKHRNMNQVKTNFFEGNVANYSKNSLDMSGF